MAEKRMFAKCIVNSDVFLDLSLSAQALYFHLCMEADDYGFVGNPKRVQRFIGASNDDMSALLEKRYLLSFESGVVVIKHWFTNNFIRSDRIKETTYIEEYNMLTLDEKKAYTEKAKKHLKKPNVIPNGNQTTTKGQPRLDKIRLDKIRLEREGAHTREPEIEKNIENDVLNENIDNFASDLDCLSGIPTLQEIKDFITLKEYPIDPEYFYNYYMAQGWKRNGQPIENWQALATQWGRTELLRNNMKDLSKPQVIKPKIIEPNFEERKYTTNDMDVIFKGTAAENINDDDL